MFYKIKKYQTKDEEVKLQDGRKVCLRIMNKARYKSDAASIYANHEDVK